MTTTTCEPICEHCGAALVPNDITMGGRTYHMGFRGCTCEAALRAEQEQRRLQAEAERKVYAEQEATLLRRIGVPQRYLQAEHSEAQNMANDVMKGKKSLFIHGTQGTGKTHMAMSIVRYIAPLMSDICIEIVPEFLECMRNRNVEDRAKTEKLKKCRLLVLDDIGKEAPTAYACERLFDIINARYNAMLPVIVTSNFGLTQLAKRLSEGDTGRSIASRLAEMCKRIPVNGQDRRLQ